MAVVKTVLKNVNQEAVIKVAGTAAAATIDLSTDLVASTQALDGETQTVNIVGLVWTGATNGIIEITRNSVVIATLQANAAGALDFAGQQMIPETISNTSDIVVTISGAQAECWIRVKKVGGYKTKVEYATYGAYEDESRVGASTTLPGSPDYTPE
jgi:hypothetical protein